MVDSLEISYTDWFTIPDNRSQRQNLKIDKFIEKAEGYIKKHVNNLSAYKEKYFLKELKCVMDEDKFKKICTLASSMTNKYTPILTFHGTTNPKNINSIVKYGYFMPNEILPEDGRIIRTAHGNYYGDGIYTTQDFQTAFFNSFEDDVCSLYVVINLVILGNVEFVYDTKYQGGLVTPIDDVFYDDDNNKIHTRIIKSANKFQSASSKYVFPIFVGEYKSQVNYEKIGSYWCSDHKLVKESKKEPKLLDGSESITFYKITEDMYTFTPPPKLIKQCNLVHHLLIPIATRRDNKLQGYVKNFIAGLGDDMWLYMYDEHTIIHKLDNAEAYTNYMNPERKVKGGNIENVLMDTFNKITKFETDAVHVVYLFVFNNTSEITESFENVIKTYKMYVRVKRIIFKIICVNCLKPIINKLLEIKMHFSNEYVWEDRYHEIISEDDNTYINTFENLVIENNNIIGKTQVALYKNYTGEGFVNNLLDVPIWNSEKHGNYLYKGRKLNVISIDSINYKIEYSDSMDKLTAIDVVIEILSRLRNNIIDKKMILHRYQPIITKLCSGIMSNVEKELTAESIDKKIIPFLKKFSVRIATILGELISMATISFTGKWYSMLNNMKFKKGIIKRINNCGILTNKDADTINGCDKFGYGVRLITTPASEVEPWLVLVDYVSTDKFQTNKMYYSSEFNTEIKDSKNQIITDILPIDMYLKSYYAYVFTKNPYLYIPGQVASLHTNVFVKLTENFFKNDARNITDLLRIMDMIKYIGNMEYFKTRSDLLNKIIMNSENFETFLTETHEIHSVSLLLGMLCGQDASKIFKLKHYSKFAFALLAEAIMRTCRSYSKIGENESLTNYDHIRKIININPDTTNIDDYKIDINKATARTNKILKRNYTNTSPWSVCAVLELLERVHNNDKLDDIIKAFNEKEISMKNFLNKHLPSDVENWAKIVHVALFLQGFRYNKAKLRDLIKFDNPEKIIKDIVQEQIDYTKKYRKIKQNLIDAKADRRSLLMQKAQIYEEYHKFPAVFNYAEIAIMNTKRPPNDQLEMLPNGLLKHHCCYPECPDYLKNFATENDIKLNKRGGLFRHLSLDQTILINYVPEFHLYAHCVMKNKLTDFNTFKDKMDEHFINSKWYRNCKLVEPTLKKVWQQYQ
ncbi:MAG: hypothetical protein Edafosvirus29_11 [Edafosvirus sp.]|uniref:PARP catalytic domain-containing protein n=1 Tax=Edafosvirus sp. TaxID=2487765 RepID=A0A3G4ZV08_9VIRU|nr:MAG: hypothetical protein Edafosvirus29_11 [Edafosvirus sp.]